MTLLHFSQLSDQELAAQLQSLGISLTVSEAREVYRTLGRDPSLVELHIFNTQWSEHCSYKSSRIHLRQLPTSAPWVIQGPQEDAGIIELGYWNGRRWGIVFGHESHNHPSQIVPYEGAATGIGGIIRDVLCMGAHVFAVADALRFGNPHGSQAATVRYVADGVVAGVAGYGNAVGIPNIAGDVYWHSGYDGNCLVNVVCLGIVDAAQIIHSRVPKGGIGWDIVLVGKATDSSGFGGAAFSSGVLATEKDESSKGAVQVPDPFLKSVLIRATEAVFAEIQQRNLSVGFKDLGAGGIACASSELGDAAGIGVEIWLDHVPLALPNLPPHIIACAETQERLMWVVPPDFTPILLAIYNEQFALGEIAHGAGAFVIGRTRTDDRYLLTYNADTVCDAPLHAICRGISYERPQAPPPARSITTAPSPDDKALRATALAVLGHHRVASRSTIYSRYDQEVQGNTVLRPGEADAGVVRPLPGAPFGVALTTDCVPDYCYLDPFQGAQLAVAEAARNVATTGAMPRALTDCLNMGDPEDPTAFRAFIETVRGLAYAAQRLGPDGEHGPPLPFVSGNVSFYNETTDGRAIPPTPIIACVGVHEDVSKALASFISQEHLMLILLGTRQNALGGSVFETIQGYPPGPLPEVDYPTERAIHRILRQAATSGWLRAAHDISDGGLFATICEVLLGPDGQGRIGATIEIGEVANLASVALFAENGGVILAVSPDFSSVVQSLATREGLSPIILGETGGTTLTITVQGSLLFTIPLEEAAQAWLRTIPEALE